MKKKYNTLMIIALLFTANGHTAEVEDQDNANHGFIYDTWKTIKKLRDLKREIEPLKEKQKIREAHALQVPQGEMQTYNYFLENIIKLKNNQIDDVKNQIKTLTKEAQDTIPTEETQSIITQLQESEAALIAEKEKSITDFETRYSEVLELFSMDQELYFLERTKNEYLNKLTAYKQSWGSTVVENGIRFGLASVGSAVGFAVAHKLTTPWLVKKASQTSWFRQLPKARQQHLQQKTLPKVFTGVTMMLFAALALIPSQMIIRTWN